MTYSFSVGGSEFHIETAEGLFSPSHIDQGTLAMLENTEIKPEDKVLDLGCGAGPVGIYAAGICGAERVVMCDILPEACSLAEKNAERNGFAGIRTVVSDGFHNIEDRDFTLILSNPPYHTDFSVAKGFIENGFKHLAVGGRMVMVTKRHDWYYNKLKSVFGGIRETNAGEYYIFTAEKRSSGRPAQNSKSKKPGGLSKKLARKKAREIKDNGHKME